MVGQEGVEVFVGMGGQAQEDVAQVGEGVETMTFSALDHAVQGCAS